MFPYMGALSREAAVSMTKQRLQQDMDAGAKSDAADTGV